MAHSTTTAEADARIVSKDKDVNLPGFTLVRQWVYLDATVVDTLSVALDAVATYTDPKADNQTYTGTFVNSKVEVIDDSKDGFRAPTIRQTLVKVTSIASVSDLPSDPVVTQENEILDTLGIQTGEEDTMVYIYNNLNSADATRKECMDVTDSAYQDLANVATNSPASGWIYADKKFEENNDKTARLIVIFKQVDWQDWGHDSYAADITVKSNIGTDGTYDEAGEVLSIRKTWLRINKANLATAVSDLTTGTNTTPESGYVIIDVDVSDNRDGSVTLRQTQVKSINGVNETGSVQLNPHGIKNGTTTNVVTVYRNFTRSGLPAGTTASAGSNIISNIPSIQGDGLWSREVLTRVPTWTNTWDDGGSPRTINAIKMSESDTGGYQLTENNEATGISETNRAASFAAAQTPSDADTRLVTMVQLVERANGERVINQTEKRVYTGVLDADATIINIGANIGNRAAQLGRIWWRRTSVARTTLTTSSGKAINNYIYDGTTYLHTDVRIDDNGDGSFNVYQLLTIPINKASSFGSRHQTTSEVQWKHDEVVVNDNATGLPTKKDRTIYRKVFSTYDGALAYVDAGTGGTLIAIESTNYKDANGITKHMGYVEFLGEDGSGNSSWAGYNVQLL